MKCVFRVIGKAGVRVRLSYTCRRDQIVQKKDAHALRGIRSIDLIYVLRTGYDITIGFSDGVGSSESSTEHRACVGVYISSTYTADNAQEIEHIIHRFTCGVGVTSNRL
jgi:hypothetical protein